MESQGSSFFNFLFSFEKKKKVQNPGIAVIVTNVALQEKQPKTSFTGTDSTTNQTCKRYSIFSLFYCMY
jgi:hypothetical protein